MSKSKAMAKPPAKYDAQLAESALAVLARGNGSQHDGKVYTTYDIEEGVGCGHGKDGDPLMDQLHILALERRPPIVSTSRSDDGKHWRCKGGYCWALAGTEGVVAENHAERMDAESAKHKRNK